jgi:hypothetical protein
MSSDKKDEDEMILPDKKGEDECLLDQKSREECLLHKEGELEPLSNIVLDNSEGASDIASGCDQCKSTVKKTVKKNKTFKIKKSKKLLFRERNGAAYQNPKDASSDEGPSDISLGDFESQDDKAKGYSFSQRIVSSKIRKAMYRIGRKYPIDKKMFNRRHLKEILSDKDSLLDWYEQGVSSRATIPVNKLRIVSQLPDTRVESRSSPQPRQVTLDEFCTSQRLESLKISSHLPKEQREQLEIATSEYVRTIMSIDIPTDKDPFLCQEKCPMYFAQEQMDKHLKKNPQDRPMVPGLKIPLCIHAVKYFAGNLYRELYVEACNSLSTLPRKQLSAFAEAVRILTAAVKVLRDDNKIFGLHYCDGPTCDWQTSIERSAANIASNFCRGYQHLGMDPKDSFDLTLRENRVSFIRSNRTENREDTSVEILSYFVERIYRSAALLVDSLPEFEANFLRREIKAFVNAARDMVDKEESPETTHNESSYQSWLKIKAQKDAMHHAMYEMATQDQLEKSKVPRPMPPLASKLLVTLEESKLPRREETAAETCQRIARLVLPLITGPDSSTDSSSGSDETSVIRLSSKEIERIVSENINSGETKNITQELTSVEQASHSEGEEVKY